MGHDLNSRHGLAPADKCGVSLSERQAPLCECGQASSESASNHKDKNGALSV